jgi:hypothetical protein
VIDWGIGVGREPRWQDHPARLALSLACAVFAVALLVGPTPARALAAQDLSVWQEGAGSGRPFSLASYDGVASASGTQLSLMQKVWWAYEGTSVELAGKFAPLTAQRLANGDTLIADANNQVVLEVSHDLRVVWSYSQADDRAMLRPFSAFRTDSGTTLIADRNRFQVIEVDAAKTIVWRYGSGISGSEPGQVADPFSAVRLASGNTLITDNQKGWRVFEVRSSDYRPGAAGDGYGPDSVVWQYGHPRAAGSGEGFLYSPRCAERLTNGDTLICDAWNQRVLEVTPAGRVAWQYGIPGQKGSSPGLLVQPSWVTRLSDGDTLISDKDAGRVVEVTPDGAVAWEFGHGPSTPADGSLSEPRSSQRLQDGSTLIADDLHGRVIEAGFLQQATASSSRIDFGAPGVAKRFDSLSWTADTPAGTSIEVLYSLDGGSYQSAGTSGSFSFPARTKAETIAYQVLLRTADKSRTPALEGLSIRYGLWTAADDAGGGPKTGGGTSPRGTGGRLGGTGAGGTRPVGQGARTVFAPGSGTDQAVQLAGGGPGGSGGTGGGSTGGTAVKAANTITGTLLERSVAGDAKRVSLHGTPGDRSGRSGAAGAGLALAMIASAYGVGLASSGGGAAWSLLIRVIARA